MSNSNLALNNNFSSEILEKVITSSDLGGLSSSEKLTHIKNVCVSLGLNPLTKPIQLIKFQGKEIAYFTKDATEQLRKTHKISITNMNSQILTGDIYLVTVSACTPDGRTDSSTGAICISGLKGDNLCNAMLKAETKAKRRVTLSICGLGYIDESETESIQGAKKVDVYKIEQIEEILNIDTVLWEISESESIESLQEIYMNAYKTLVTNRDKENLAKLVLAKDKRKKELKNMEEDKIEVN